MRVVNLALLRDAVTRWGSGSPDRESDALLRILDAVIAPNAEFVWMAREEFTAPRGNHFAVQIAALALAETSGALGEARSHRLAWCRKHLAAEIMEQIDDHGEDVEGSPAYHGLVVESFLLAWAALRAQAPRGALASALVARLTAGVTYLLRLRRPDGQLVRFGDSDDAGFFADPCELLELTWPCDPTPWAQHFSQQ